jgi:hypothetical protein
MSSGTTYLKARDRVSLPARTTIRMSAAESDSNVQIEEASADSKGERRFSRSRIHRRTKTPRMTVIVIPWGVSWRLPPP